MSKQVPKKHKNLHVRLPGQEKAEFVRAAEARGLDLSTWVRLVLRRAAGLDRR